MYFLRKGPANYEKAYQAQIGWNSLLFQKVVIWNVKIQIDFLKI